MKLWVPMLVLLLAVSSLCLWDTLHTKYIFSTLEEKSNNINIALQTTS